MKFEITITKEVNVKYVEVSAAVRYGDEDMPHDAPMRHGDTWKATIEIDTGRVCDWPQGKTLEFFMKVCDSGTYRLIGTDGYVFASIEQDYVPNKLLPGEYGDYLAMDIDATGKVTNWLKNPSLSDFIKERAS